MGQVTTCPKPVGFHTAVPAGRAPGASKPGCRAAPTGREDSGPSTGRGQVDGPGGPLPRNQGPPILQEGLARSRLRACGQEGDAGPQYARERGTTPAWPRRAEGGGQGLRVTTGHPELPGPAHTVWWHTVPHGCPAPGQLPGSGCEACGTLDGAKGPLCLCCPGAWAQEHLSLHVSIPWGLKWADPDRKIRRKPRESGAQQVCAHACVCPDVSTDSSFPRTSGNPAAPAKGDSCPEPRSCHTRPADAP